MININIGEILSLDSRTERPYNTASRVHYLKLNNLFTASGVVLILAVCTFDCNEFCTLELLNVCDQR